MARTEEVLSRTVSPDGAALGVWSSGRGPPLVLVHGMAADHTRWNRLLPHLEGFARVHAMDRRGRGASGDGTRYDLALEFADVAAVVDAVADRSGSPVDVYGHSLGATCALGGAARTSNVRRLVVYEPAVSSPEVSPVGFVDRLDAMLAAGRPASVVEALLRELLQLNDQQVQEVVALPSWPGRVAAAPTIPRELRAEGGLATAVDPATAERVTVPTLMLVGGDSPEWIRADAERTVAALPAARLEVLEGQEHLADVAAPEIVADRLRTFLRGGG